MAGTEEIKADLRKKKILELLEKNGRVRVSDLSIILKTSEVTIRSDLTELEKNGFLERVHGGAISNFRSYYNMSYAERKSKNIEQKKKIASTVASMINNGETILMNSGTTTYFIACALKNHMDLKVVTNSIAVAMELGYSPNINVILLGGSVNAQYSFTYGDDALAQLKKYKMDKLVLSIDGIDTESGLTTYHFEECEINKIMLDRANKKIAVADYSKVGRENFSYISPVSEIDYLVTDSSANKETLDSLAENGIEIVVAE